MTPTPDNAKNNARYFTLGRISASLGSPHFMVFLNGCSPLEALVALSDLLDEEFSDLDESDAEMILRAIAFGVSQQWAQTEAPEFVVPLGSSVAIPVANWRDAE